MSDTQKTQQHSDKETLAKTRELFALAIYYIPLEKITPGKAKCSRITGQSKEYCLDEKLKINNELFSTVYEFLKEKREIYKTGFNIDIYNDRKWNALMEFGNDKLPKILAGFIKQKSHLKVGYSNNGFGLIKTREGGEVVLKKGKTIEELGGELNLNFETLVSQDIYPSVWLSSATKVEQPPSPVEVRNL